MPRMEVSRSLATIALCVSATGTQAATIAAAWNLQWTGALGINGIWAITASSGFNDGDATKPPSESPPYDHVDANVAINGEVVIRDTGSLNFTGDDVIGLALTVDSAGVRISDFAFTEEELKFGVMSGAFSGVPGPGATVSLSHVVVVQDTPKFRQQFGCTGIFSNECSNLYTPPLPSFPSGDPVPPGPSGMLYGTLVVQDGRADPCCGARVNQLRFLYPTRADALASINITFNERRVFPDDDIPGLPAPILLPATLPLLLAGLGGFGFIRRRRQVMAD